MNFNKKKVFLLILAFIVGLYIYRNFIEKKTENDVLTIKRENYKERLANNEIKKAHSFDEKYNIYTNSYYNISFDGPDNWDTDFGIGDKSIYRTYDKKNGITFKILVDEFQKEQTKYYNSWSFYGENKERYEKTMRNQISKGKGYNFNFERGMIRNNPTIKTTCNYKIKSINKETEFQFISHMTFGKKFIHSFGLVLPKNIYDNNKIKYEEFFNNVYFLKDKD